MDRPYRPPAHSDSCANTHPDSHPGTFSRPFGVTFSAIPLAVFPIAFLFTLVQTTMSKPVQNAQSGFARIDKLKILKQETQTILPAFVSIFQKSKIEADCDLSDLRPFHPRFDL